MTDQSNQAVAVKILDREYMIACSAQERTHLTAAATLVDQQMRDLRQQSRNTTLDRIAVLVALNLANELIQMKQASQGTQSALDVDVLSLKTKLEAVLSVLSKRS